MVAQSAREGGLLRRTIRTRRGRCTWGANEEDISPEWAAQERIGCSAAPSRSLDRMQKVYVVGEGVREAEGGLRRVNNGCKSGYQRL